MTGTAAGGKFSRRRSHSFFDRYSATRLFREWDWGTRRLRRGLRLSPPLHFPPPSAWSRAGRHEGLGHDGLGWAWVWLTLRDAGLVADSLRGRGAVAGLLEKGLSFMDPTAYAGFYLGSGGGPLAASLLAATDRTARPLLAPLVRRWRARASRCVETDLMLGSAGALLAALEIERRLPGTVPEAFIREMGARARESLVGRLELSRERPVTLGLSHGIAGILLTLEAWGASGGPGPGASLRSKCLALLERSAVALPGGGAIWHNESGAPVAASAIHGWCHGGAGLALAALWGRALSGSREYDKIIEPALIGAARVDSWNSSFCCGSIGRAQVLLEGHALTGDRRWLAAAREVAGERAALPNHRLRGGFLKGMLGRVYLDWRLAHPGRLPLPGFAGLEGLRRK